jgi:FMN-dependent NADH-azoreductase
VIVIESRGGLYSEGPAQALDFQEPYLRQLLGFVGLKNVSFVRAERIGFGAEVRAAAISAAVAELRRAATPAARAA